METIDSYPRGSRNVKDNGVAIISVFERLCYYLWLKVYSRVQSKI